MKKEEIESFLSIHEAADKIAKSENTEINKEYKEEYLTWFKHYLIQSKIDCIIEFRNELWKDKEETKKEEKDFIESSFEYGYISQKIKQCQKELKAKKNQGGKREGAGRHKLKIPNKRIGIAIDLADACKNITDAYQSTTPEKRKLIIEYLKKLEEIIK